MYSYHYQYANVIQTKKGIDKSKCPLLLCSNTSSNNKKKSRTRSLKCCFRNCSCSSSSHQPSPPCRIKVTRNVSEETKFLKINLNSMHTSTSTSCCHKTSFGMVSDSHPPPPSPPHHSLPLSSVSFPNRIFSDVADGDITITVDGHSFLLHKFPLVSHSGKIRKMVANSKDSRISKMELKDLPGGFQTFELAAKFCYGINVEINTANVAHLRCAAEYLEMSQDYHDQNLIACTETYLNEVMSLSLEKSVQVLSSCETLLPVAEEVGIVNRCVDAITNNACKEQFGSVHVMDKCIDRWVEDLSVLKIDFYERVISEIRRTGSWEDIAVASLMHYAQVSLKGIGKPQIWHPTRNNPLSVETTGQRVIVETLVSLLPTEKTSSSSIPINFLFGMLRTAIMVDAALACRLELEQRIAFRMETVSLDDLLIPSLRTGNSLFDVDTIHRILVHFLQHFEADDQSEDYCGYESEVVGSPSHGSVLKVGHLVDAYLAEIASDPYLSLDKFTTMIQVMPDYARVIDDGLYRAVDIYLKAHPMLTEHECKRLCKFIDCQKLSQEASNHAAQNDRLPVHMVVRVLYFEQIRLKNALSGSSGEGFLSQKISSGVASAVMSPRDTYASLRRENRELKLEISRMRVRLSDLEKEQVCMKQGMINKSGNGRTFLTSISRGIGKMGIFGVPASGKHKSGRKMRAPEGKTGSRKFFVS